MLNTVDLFITAPNGCSSAVELLTGLEGQLNSKFKVSILETSGLCTPDSFLGLNLNIEHVYFDTHEESEMRRDAFVKSNADWVLVLEDHITVAEDFISEFLLYIENNEATPATTFYAVNGTSDSLGSRALFSWVWGLAEGSLYPKKPEPVCSAFAIKRSIVADRLKKRQTGLMIGELETQIVPETINTSDSMFMTQMVVSHYEYVGLRLGASAIYSNARITGHLEKELLTWTAWGKHLLFRFSMRPRQIQKIAPKGSLELLWLNYFTLVGFTGFLIGGLFGFGKADVDLAAAHPKIIK